MEDGFEGMKFSTFLIIDGTTVTSGSEAIDGPTMIDLIVGKGPFTTSSTENFLATVLGMISLSKPWLSMPFNTFCALASFSTSAKWACTAFWATATVSWGAS